MDNQQENSKTESTELPFKAGKKTPYKLYGVFLLLLTVVIVNFFFLDKEKVDQKPDEAIDNYALKQVNPMVNSDDQPTTASKNINPFQDRLRQELETAKAKDFVERLQAAQGVSAGGQGTDAYQSREGTTHASLANDKAGSYPMDSNTAYMQHASQAQPEKAYADKLQPLPYLIGQGKFIFASLSVAINSDLPGQVSAVVSQDVYGEQGRNVLIPRGSRLIGEYRSGLADNQSRVFVVWTRVIQPNGISVMIGSEGTDPLGQAGLTGSVNHHFFARFGTATLLSLISAGASTVGVNPNDEYNSMAAYRQAVSQALSQQATDTMSKTANIPPTVQVPQGSRIVVFVNKDLDFSRVYR